MFSTTGGPLKTHTHIYICVKEGKVYCAILLYVGGVSLWGQPHVENLMRFMHNFLVSELASNLTCSPPVLEEGIGLEFLILQALLMMKRPGRAREGIRQTPNLM